jgi:hypothetical protein
VSEQQDGDGPWTTLTVDRPRADVAVLTLQRPERLNAMTDAMFSELETLALTLDREEGLRVVVLTGAGRAFCAGYDLAEAEKLTSLGAIGMLDLQERAARALAAVRSLRVPVIAAVHGAAAGSPWPSPPTSGSPTPPRRSTPRSCASGSRRATCQVVRVESGARQARRDPPAARRVGGVEGPGHHGRRDRVERAGAQGLGRRDEVGGGVVEHAGQGPVSSQSRPIATPSPSRTSTVATCTEPGRDADASSAASARTPPRRPHRWTSAPWSTR